MVETGTFSYLAGDALRSVASSATSRVPSPP
ncbi:hypothetical protein QFZ24_000579 [Streptomyces phaeochromogenes]|nr:hypothetical protein [Streptomyces phaeochromogenes]